ncbi:unnamed protein product [Diatraea saccharalis]|uniref:Uncharacterized protein n=1 Tax=Diatraea saccharalis TaxID=40085 RepID=A0A9N9RGB4_9NEOP|nr:unnamed protein product [Diatraea saccharalis]
MSIFVNSMLKKSCSYSLRTVVPSRSIYVTQVQQLYSQASLGIDGYLHTRKKIKEQFANFTDKFRTKMTEFVTDPKNMIFTEDLKNMIHLAEPTDLKLVTNMIKKFNSDNSEFRFGSFVFGPVVMRMYHFLDAPNEALKCFEDPNNSGFFDQLVSYQILMDLLYNHEMYEEIYRVFERIKERQINMTKFPKYPLVLVFASCYKQNTPQSLEYASKLWSEMTSVGTVPLRRTSTYFAALALKQGKPQIAIESISSLKQHYVTIRNIKVMGLADMDRVDDAFPVLRSVMEIDVPEQTHKHTFFEETISRVRQAVEKSKNQDVKKEFENIEKALRDRGLVDEQTLDQLLNSEITLTMKKEQPRGIPSQIKRYPYSHRQRKNFSSS